MAAVSLSKGSAVKVDGRMVDVPVIRKAAEILAGIERE
jgi:citrate lyase beta subunit